MFKKLAITAALGAFGFVSAPAFASPLFTIQEGPTLAGSTMGAISNQATGDKLNGSYSEKLTIKPAGNFTTSALGEFSALVNGVPTANTQLGGLYEPGGSGTGATAAGDALAAFGSNQYRLYFTFTAAGGFIPPGGFAGGVGTFNLYMDPLRNSEGTLGADGDAAPTFSNTTDDFLIASAMTVEYGLGNVINPGAFEIVWSDFTLTAQGKAYFIAPDPFYIRVLVDGDFDEFVPGIGGYVPGTTQTFDVRGDVSAVFLVPEPTSLALAGLALVGLGLSRRRKAV